MEISKSISIEQANKIVDHYFDALKNSNGIFKIPLLKPYSINEAIISFKLCTAYSFYSKQYSIEHLQDFAEKNSASIMLYLIGFQNQESEKLRLHNSKDTKEYLLEAASRCFGEDENLKSFLVYLIQINESKDFWELVYSRLRILYDINDSYLSAYFKDSSDNMQNKTEFLKYLISFEFALIELNSGDTDLGVDLLNSTIDGLKDLDAVYRNNSTFQYTLGRIYFRGGKYSTAIDHFTKAIALNSKFGYSYFYRAIAYEGLGKYLEREADFNQAERLGVSRTN